MRHRAFISASLLLIVLANCSGASGVNSASASKAHAKAPSQLLPPGVELPDSTPSPMGAYNGIFPGRFAHDPYCCWLGREATFQTKTKPGARQLDIAVFIPDLAPFRRQKQDVAASIAGGAKTFRSLGIGHWTLSLPLRASQTEHVLTVTLAMRFTFVPKVEHITNDGRSLSLYLKNVASR